MRENASEATIQDIPKSIERVLDIAMEAGMIILQSGGETYRTEETMISLATALGAASASAFVTPTVVMLSCIDPEGGTHTRLQRITKRSINLGKIARVNSISRQIAERKRPINLNLLENLFRRIRNSPEHSKIGVIIATAFSGFCFSLMFQGTLTDAAIAFGIGAVMRIVLFLIEPLGISGFFISVIGGFVISLLSGAVVACGFAVSSGNISISVLMALVPGLAIVNAIRDIIAGDLVAGSARLLEACVIAAALSLGAAFGLLIFPAGTSYQSAILFLQDPVLSFFLAFFATAAFAYFFHINHYDIFWTAFCGAIGWGIYLSVSRYYFSQTAAYFCGALCVGLISELFAFAFKKPATICIVPGIIPLVPGGGLYETMLMAVLGRMDDAATTGFQTLSAAAAIAVGIALASSIARLITVSRRQKKTPRDLYR